MDSQRSLAAIVFTDAVGFAGRANVDEADALDEIERDFVIMRESCTRHDGQVLKSLGDGLLMVFSSAVQAVLCSIDIQDRLQKGEVNDPLLHRIGIHLGDIILSENDAKGDGVNIAARLEQEAPAGGICMSGTIYDVVKSRLSVQVRSRGITQLKNIAEPIQVYEISPSAETIEKVSLRRREEPERQSMAITYAIFFLGICILGAAGIYFMANRKKEPETIPFPFSFSNPSDASGDSRIIRKTPTGTSEFRGDPSSPEFRRELEKMRVEMLRTLPDISEFEEQIRKAEDLKVKAGKTNMTLRPMGKGETPPKGYDEARDTFSADYRFDEMVSWIKAQSWAARPLGQTALRHWEKLVQMKVLVKDAIQKAGDTTVAIGDEGGDLSAIAPEQMDEAIRSMKPYQFRAVAVALAAKTGKTAELRPLLTAFDLEYTKGGIGRMLPRRMVNP